MPQVNNHKWIDNYIKKAKPALPTRRVFKLESSSLSFKEATKWKANNKRHDLVHNSMPKNKVSLVLKRLNQETKKLKMESIIAAAILTMIVIPLIVFISLLVFLITFQKGRYIFLIGVIFAGSLCVFLCTAGVLTALVGCFQAIALKSLKKKLVSVIEEEFFYGEKMGEDRVDNSGVMWTIGEYGTWFSADMMFLYNHINSQGNVVDRRKVSAPATKSKKKDKKGKDYFRGINDYKPLPYCPPGFNFVDKDEKGKPVHEFKKVIVHKELPPIINLKRNLQ